MTRDIAKIAFRDRFISAWLFDVEIIWRIINNYERDFFLNKAKEIPLNKLNETRSSRIKLSNLFNLPIEFLKIHFFYRNKSITT